MQPARPSARVSLCRGPAQPLSACLCAAPRLARAPPGARKGGGGVARDGPLGLAAPLSPRLAALPSFPNSLLLPLRCPRPGSPPRTPSQSYASTQLPIRPPRGALGPPPAREQQEPHLHPSPSVPLPPPALAVMHASSTGLQAMPSRVRVSRETPDPYRLSRIVKPPDHGVCVSQPQMPWEGQL
ncbi:hypothetical protein LEMLEM_LOCUS24621 [Lemmus lemmus]